MSTIGLMLIWPAPPVSRAETICAAVRCNFQSRFMVSQGHVRHGESDVDNLAWRDSNINLHDARLKQLLPTAITSRFYNSSKALEWR